MKEITLHRMKPHTQPRREKDTQNNSFNRTQKTKSNLKCSQIVGKWDFFFEAKDKNWKWRKKSFTENVKMEIEKQISKSRKEERKRKSKEKRNNGNWGVCKNQNKSNTDSMSITIPRYLPLLVLQKPCDLLARETLYSYKHKSDLNQIQENLYNQWT